jgi:integrase
MAKKVRNCAILGAANPPPSKGRLARKWGRLFLLCCYDKSRWGEKAQIARFRNTQAKKFAIATANLELKTVRMLFRAARLDGYLFQDPAEAVKGLKDRGHDKVKRRPFTLEELRSILANADEERRSMIKFGIYTGQPRRYRLIALDPDRSPT